MRRFLAPRTADAIRNNPGQLGYLVACRPVKGTVDRFRVTVATLDTFTGRPYYPMHKVNGWQTEPLSEAEAHRVYRERIAGLKAKGYGIARDPRGR